MVVYINIEHNMGAKDRKMEKHNRDINRPAPESDSSDEESN